MTGATCNKCNRDGLKWSKKTLDDGRVINILLEADGSDHRTKVGQEYVCKGSITPKPVEGQSQLPAQAKPETKVNLNDSIAKILEIDDLIHTNALHQCSKQYKPLFQNSDLISAEIELLVSKEKLLLEIARSKLLA